MKGKGKNLKWLLLGGLMMMFILGCSLAADLAGNIAASSLESYQSKPVIGQETERHKVGIYEVSVSDGFYRNSACTIFTAYNQGRLTKLVYFEKESPEDMKMINDFNQMSETEKKQQIRKWFIQYSKFDLGPIESETPKETATPAPASPPNIPAPTFAPIPR